MSLKIAEVIAKVNKQEDPTMGMVRDGPIFYLVINFVEKQDWLMNDANLLQCQNLLDQIDREHKEGEPACLVTISSHAKKFCTGQDTDLWGEKGMIGPL